jgi:adenosylmethionine-8-amino-7-oxononanoate aminotransferase
VSSVFPRVFGERLPLVARAEGAIIEDADGNSYIDAAGGAIVVGIGHGYRAVIDAITDQQRRVAYAHGTQFTSEGLEAYAEEVARVLPIDRPHVYPVAGGSEAVETALKMARAFHVARGQESRHKVIARHGSYHGSTLGALDASGRRLLRAPYEPWLGRAVHVPAAYEYRCPLKTHPESCGRRHAEILDETIEREEPNRVACFVAEPVVGAALGAVPPPDDYWPAIANVCRKHGVLLLADEVMTGFGRTGKWFGSDHWGVRPDILAAGKGASSGYWPFGFAACSRRIFDTLAGAGFTHGFTYSHNVVGAAAARAVLGRLDEMDLVAASARKGEALRGALDRALGDHRHVGDVRGLGLMVGVELVHDKDDRRPFDRSARVVERVLYEAKQRGILLYPSTGVADGINGDVVMLGPPFIVTQSQLERTVSVLGDVLDALTVPV